MIIWYYLHKIERTQELTGGNYRMQAGGAAAFAAKMLYRITGEHPLENKKAAVRPPIGGNFMADKKVKIPAANKDVKRAIIARLAGQIAFILAWCAVVTAAAYFMGYLGDPIGMAFVELLWIFPFWYTKIWRWFTTERAYCGVVTEVKLNNTVDSKGVGLPVMGHVRHQTVEIKGDDGKTHTVNYVDRGDGKRVEYAVGDRVCHYWGAKYLQKLGTEENICVLCGTMCGSGEDVCGVCGKSIINNGYGGDGADEE